MFCCCFNEPFAHDWSLCSAAVMMLHRAAARRWKPWECQAQCLTDSSTWVTASRPVARKRRIACGSIIARDGSTAFGGAGARLPLPRRAGHLPKGSVRAQLANFVRTSTYESSGCDRRRSAASVQNAAVTAPLANHGANRPSARVPSGAARGSA